MSKTFSDCNDENILQWLKHGNERQKQRAMTCLYQLFYSKVIGWVIHRGGSAEDGHDALSDAMMTFGTIVRKAKYRHEGKLEQFFFKVAQFKFFNICRKRKDNPNEGMISMEEIFPGGIPPEIISEDLNDELEKNDKVVAQLKLVEENITKLKGKCKERLYRFYDLDQGDTEIALALGDKSPAVSKVMRNKCMKKLRLLVFKNKN